MITDGDRSQVVTVLVKSPRFALSKAGVVLGSEDRYTTQPGDGIWKITLQRNQEVTVNYCGDLISTGSYGEPVGDLLNRLDIPCDGNFIVSLPLDTETYDGMEIKVDCVVQMQQTYTEEIPFKTIVCDDPTLAVGQEQVLTEGNILVTRTGRPVIIDMGAARERNSDPSGAVVESPGYSPPEQGENNGNLGPWTDLYAFAATLYYLLTGIALPPGRQRLLYDTLDPLASLPALSSIYHPKLLAGIDKALSPSIEGRYRNAGEWMADLRAH